MLGNDVITYRKAEPGPSRPRFLAGCAAVEALENLLLLFCRDSEAGVAHIDGHPTRIIRIKAGLHADGAVFRGVIHRVGEQIREDLGELARITVDA